MNEDNNTNQVAAFPASTVVSQQDVSAEENVGTGPRMAGSPSDNDPSRFSRFITGLILIFVTVAVVVGVIAVTSPETFLAIINAFWLVMFCLVTVFLLLGVLIMIGLKNQVKEILDIFVAGSLTVVDFMQFVKDAWKFILEVFKQVIYFLVPVFAYGIGAAIYFGLMFAFKWVGKTYHDVTLFTIFLAAALTIAVGFLNKPLKNKNDNVEPTWLKKVQLRFKDLFSDAIEVVLFVFFLTMDSTKLFFLPWDLGSIELESAYKGYDFMVRGFTIDGGLRTTLSLVMIAVGIEILRFAIRILAAGMKFYKEVNMYMGDDNKKLNGAGQIKWAIRQGFEVHKDDSVGFITYTTFIVIVFLAFPRLKLLAMAVASTSALILDLAMKNRLVIKKKHDLFSKLIAFLFRV